MKKEVLKYIGKIEQLMRIINKIEERAYYANPRHYREKAHHLIRALSHNPLNKELLFNSYEILPQCNLPEPPSYITNNSHKESKEEYWRDKLKGIAYTLEYLELSKEEKRKRRDIFNHKWSGWGYPGKIELYFPCKGEYALWFSGEIEGKVELEGYRSAWFTKIRERFENMEKVVLRKEIGWFSEYEGE